MVKTGTTRSDKFSAKHDPLAIMLRLKRMQALAKFNFQVPATQDAYIDENVKAWATEFDLPFGQRAVLSDITKEYVWKINKMSALDLALLHSLFLAKGFTEEQWTSYYAYLVAKQIEITTFYGFCNLQTGKLRSDISLQNVTELNPVFIEKFIREVTIDTVMISPDQLIEIPVERKAASFVQSKACCHFLIPDFARPVPVSLAAFHSIYNVSPSLNSARANLAVNNTVPILASSVAYAPITNYEDFGTYIEVDPNNHITVTGSKVDGTLDRNESAYVYKDKGVNHFSGDFEHLFSAKTFSGSGDVNALDFMWYLSNTVGEWQAMETHSLGLLFQNVSSYACYLWIKNVGYAAAIALTLNHLYYFKIKRVGNDTTVYVYSDAARTTLVASRTMTDASKISARYLYAIMSNNQAVSRLDGNTYIQELNLQE